MEKFKNIPFPQADDFSKILKIININNPLDIKNNSTMRIILGGISDRQIQYYVTAVIFLGILDSHKNFTNLGSEIRTLNAYNQKILICRLIVSNPVFGEVYFSEKILGCTLNREDIVCIMKKYLTYTSEEVYIRRAQTVMKWIEWINLN